MPIDNDGSATLPTFSFLSETSLGLYRSANSTLALSYGTLSAALVATNTLAAPNASALVFVANGTNIWQYSSSNIIILGAVGFLWNSDNATDVGAVANFRPRNVFAGNAFQAPSGLAVRPGLTFSSESSLGWYRSAASVMALSYGGLGVKNGTNASFGTAVLGSNGSVNVATTYVAAGDVIFLTDQTAGGTLGDIEVGGIRAGSGFTIQSTSITDTSTVGWLIVRAAV